MTALYATAVITVALTAIVAILFAAVAIAEERAAHARDTERIAVYRSALAFIMRSSREPTVQRYIARVLDPDDEEVGA